MRDVGRHFFDSEAIIIKSRYQEITPEIIRGVKPENIFEQPYNLLKQEFNTLDSAIELTGGRVSRVYKINYGGAECILKISMGLYRIIELLREVEVMKNIRNDRLGYLVPNILKCKTMENYAYLLEEYIEGESAREKLSNCKSKVERFQIWKELGKALSEIHKLYNRSDVEGRWVDEQLEIARINMDNDLIDFAEFEEETPEEMLKWLNSNKPNRKHLSLIHGDYRTKNILIDNQMSYKVIDWGFVDLGDPYYDLAIIDYYFKSSDDRDSFYQGYKELEYNKGLIEYYDKLSKFTNI